MVKKALGREKVYKTNTRQKMEKKIKNRIWMGRAQLSPFPAQALYVHDVYTNFLNNACGKKIKTNNFTT